MNVHLQLFARNWLKEHLPMLPESNHLIFKRMYSHTDLNKPLDQVVDGIEPEKLSWAMSQVENSLKKYANAPPPQ